MCSAMACFVGIAGACLLLASQEKVSSNDLISESV